MTRRSLIKRRMEKPPRAPYCTGCGFVFNKRHQLMNHRNTDRCGGRFLVAEELSLWTMSNYYFNQWQTYGDGKFYQLWRKVTIQAVQMRKVRLYEESRAK